MDYQTATFSHPGVGVSSGYDYSRQSNPTRSELEHALSVPEGTYLIWLDFRALGLSTEGLETLIEEKAGLWLDAGAIFGRTGEGFQRINIACPRKILEQAMGQLRAAVRKL